MPIINDSGTIKYWHNGLPAEGGFIAANDGGTVKYWFAGLPSGWVIPSTGEPPAGPTNIKSVNGVVAASIKSINGVVYASLKSVNGIT